MLGLELTARHSIAVDKTAIPLGMPGVLIAREPGAASPRVARFIFTHDVGSAIKGGARADLFEGAGAAAEGRCHTRSDRGRLYVFILKPAKAEDEEADR